MRLGAAARALQGEVVPLEEFVAQLARVEQVVPVVRQPVVTRSAQAVALPLLVPGLGPEVLDIPEAGVSEQGLAERAFPVLGGTEGGLDRRVGVDARVERRGIVATFVGRADGPRRGSAAVEEDGWRRGLDDANHRAVLRSFRRRSRVSRISARSRISAAVSPTGASPIS